MQAKEQQAGKTAAAGISTAAIAIETLTTSQLELALITEVGRIAQRNSPCELALNGFFDIPGLDASLCRCPSCTARGAGGIWWVDEAMRSSLRDAKKQRFAETARDSA